MAMESLLIVHENQFNREVCEDTALYFKDSSDLVNKINQVENNPENYLELKSKAFKRVKKEYSWEKITEQYHLLFKANLKEENNEGTTHKLYGDHTTRRN
jgi:rhamnosyltransferase